MELDESISSLFETETQDDDILSDLKAKQVEDQEILELIKECKAMVENLITTCISTRCCFADEKAEDHMTHRLWKGWWYQKSLRDEVLSLCQDGFAGAHLGEKKTFSKIADSL